MRVIAATRGQASRSSVTVWVTVNLRLHIRKLPILNPETSQ